MKTFNWVLKDDRVEQCLRFSGINSKCTTKIGVASEMEDITGIHTVDLRSNRAKSTY